jgi:hypothetical protein
LFVSVDLGMLNAITNEKVSTSEVPFINVAILGTLAFVEYRTHGTRREVRTPSLTPSSRTRCRATARNRLQA